MTMRTLFGVLLLSAMPSLAADSDFNGRWDLTTLTRPRAWWGELNGLGSHNPSGKFASAYGGDMNTPDTILARNEAPGFTTAKPNRHANGPAPGQAPRPASG